MLFKHTKKTDGNKLAGRFGKIFGIIAALLIVLFGAVYFLGGTDLLKVPDKNAYNGKIILIDAVGGISNKDGLEQAYLGSITLVPAYDSYKDQNNTTLNTALILKEKLENSGATVYLIRDSKFKDILNSEKGEFATRIKADAFIEIGCGISENKSAEGISGFYQSDEHSKDTLSLSSRRLAETVTNCLQKELSVKNNGIIPKSWSPDFNYSAVPAIRINIGFATNDSDTKRFSDEKYLEKAADSIYKGIGFYFGE